MSSRNGYNAVSVTGPKERCSSCELLNILGKPKFGQKRCKECIEKENRRKMKQKHIPVHLRKRNLTEQTAQASRILAEETADDPKDGGDDGILAGSKRNADDEETVKISDILEITFELLDLVDAHVHRTGSLDEVQRFENQLKVLRKGRDQAKSQGHLEDKRAIILAFSIFTEHYTLLVRDYEKLDKKNQALKQLAYDTAGLVKKSEAQFESYVSELKQLQGANNNVTQTTKIELTKLRNEVTGLKLELNLRTNELREMQLEANAQTEQLRRERERAEEMRKDKDNRITSLLAQLQQFSLDYAHEKSERLRLERENERLWTDRMAYRAEQIRGKHLSAAERALAAERDATEKREWLEWKKKSALRDLAAKERLRTEAWEVRRTVEQDAAAQMERIRRDLGQTIAQTEHEEERPSTLYGKSREQRASERASERLQSATQERNREYWMENETVPPEMAIGSSSGVNVGFPPNLSPISSPTVAGINAQRWNARMARQSEEEEIDRQIEQLRLRNEQTTARSQTYPPAPKYTSDVPVTGPLRAGGYHAGVDSVLANERSSPALPYFADTPSNTLTWQNPPSLQPNQRSTRNYTSTNQHPSAVAYQPITAAAAIPPPVAPYNPSSAALSQTAGEKLRAEDQDDLQKQIQEVQKQILLMQEQNERKTQAALQATGGGNEQPQQPQPQQHVRAPSASSAPSSRPAKNPSTDFDAIEEGLRRSRQIRGESARVARTTSSSSSYPLTAEPISSTSARSRVSSSSTTHRSSRERDDERREEKKYAARRRSDDRSRSRSPSPTRSRSVSREREREKSRRKADRHRREHETSTSDEDRSRSASRERSAPSRHTKIVDGREVVKVRDLTLYSVKS